MTVFKWFKPIVINGVGQTGLIPMRKDHRRLFFARRSRRLFVGVDLLASVSTARVFLPRRHDLIFSGLMLFDFILFFMNFMCYKNKWIMNGL